MEKSRKDEPLKTINIRIDKTVKAGKPIKKNCNENCIWCHDDLFLRQGGVAISNDLIIFCCQKIIEVAERKAKIRIAGNGEPLLAGSELVELIKNLKMTNGVQAVCLTTNGVLLANFARSLKEVGVDSINVSVNSLNRRIYEEITGKDCLPETLEGIRLAIREGITVKINTVFTKYTINELQSFIKFSQEHGVCIKFFELIEVPNSCIDLHLPISVLTSLLGLQSDEISPYEYPYFGKVFKIGDAVIDAKDTVAENTCPNMECPKREKCTEGCRRYIRLGIDGVMQPCGARKDNTLFLLNEKATLESVREALKSGGKL